MIIKIDKIVSCSSEHQSYPARNLLEYRTNVSWRCATPGELMAYVIFQLKEPVPITGVDIGNYRACVVIVTGSMSSEPDNWIPIVNHKFMSHDDAEDGRFKDQVQLFTKKELNAETMKIKFDRIKVTCMQSANMKTLFGLSFIILRTEDKKELGVDVFGRFKLKDSNNGIQDFKEKLFAQFDSGNKRKSYREELADKIKDSKISVFNQKKKVETPMKRPLLEKLESGKADEVFGTHSNASDGNKNENTEQNTLYASILNDGGTVSKKVIRSPFGDIIEDSKKKTSDSVAKSTDSTYSTNSKKRPLSPEIEAAEKTALAKKPRCSLCLANDENSICKVCNQLSLQKATVSTPKKPARKPTTPVKPKKPFNRLLEGVTFSLSGYKNPQRDEIRRKALKMGAKYVADTNSSNHRCTHLVCAFKNTPKYQQLKGSTKIISHVWVEECFEEKTRFPWRRYSLDSKDKAHSESEEEIEGSTSPTRLPDIYDQDTDSDY